MPTTPKTETKELVQDVLTHMRAAADGGDIGSLEKLGAIMSKDGEAPASTAPTAPLEALLLSEREVTRPNGHAYRVRRLGIHHDVAVMRRCREKQMSPLLTGPPGTGKTALVEAAYADTALGGRIETIQGTGDTAVSDFVGSWIPKPSAGYQWKDGPLVRAMEAGVPLLVDEIALVDPKVMAIVYGTMDGRGELEVSDNPDREKVKAREGFFVVATCNPNAPGARMGEALLSRFPVQFQVFTDYKLANKLGVNTRVCTAASNLQTKVNTGQITWAPQMRELLAYRDALAEFGMEFALGNLVASAPEMERKKVLEALVDATGESIKELVLL